MRTLWRELADLVLPTDCAGCGRPRASRALCGACQALLSDQRPRQVWPSPTPAGLPEVYAAAPYADQARAVLLAHKERGALGLGGPLGRLLAGAIPGRGQPRSGSAGRQPLILVPLPSARRAVARRGHDPTRRIARAAAHDLRRRGVRARVFSVLRQRRVVRDQSALSADQRAANLRGALEMVPGASGLLGGARVVLVDDVMTTGASLVEATRAVSVGAEERPIAAVVAASTGRFGSTGPSGKRA